MKKTAITAVFATLTSSMVFAQSATDQIINDLTGQGFQRIEIDNGIGQIKVEAIRGTQKLEVVYDRASGNILKQEVERVDADDDTRPGVEIRNRDRDFVDADSVSDGSRTTSSNSPVSTGSLSTNQIVSDLQAQGFTRIEIKNGLTQTKVEAIRGSEKVETVFDRATGDVIEREVERVDSDDDTRPGVEVQTRDRDFADGDRSDDDDDDRSGRDEDDDDDNRDGRDRNDDRDQDDDSHDDDDQDDDRDDDRGDRDDDHEDDSDDDDDDDDDD